VGKKDEIGIKNFTEWGKWADKDIHSKIEVFKNF